MTSVIARRERWSGSARESGERALAEETPVALVHDAATTAVMMATPADLEDFAIGFALTEGVIGGLDDVAGLEIVEGEAGVEARMWLARPAGARLTARRRRIAGPTGCGLCGLDSLEEALRPPPRVPGGQTATWGQVRAALGALEAGQALGARTRSVHAAAWWTPAAGLVEIREDVGRHNALDKLVGALARRAGPQEAGLLLLTSRVSVEMVQKAAVAGAQILVAVSAPTALAVRTAEAAGITLVAVARADGFEVFTHPGRIVP